MTLWPYARTEQSADPAAVPKGAADADVFIQWKGTDVCLDFRCSCGHDFHLHGYFAHAIRCTECDTVWEMPATIIPRRCDGTEYERASPRYEGDNHDD